MSPRTRGSVGQHLEFDQGLHHGSPCLQRNLLGRRLVHGAPPSRRTERCSGAAHCAEPGEEVDDDLPQRAARRELRVRHEPGQRLRTAPPRGATPSARAYEVQTPYGTVTSSVAWPAEPLPRHAYLAWMQANAARGPGSLTLVLPCRLPGCGASWKARVSADRQRTEEKAGSSGISRRGGTRFSGAPPEHFNAPMHICNGFTRWNESQTFPATDGWILPLFTNGRTFQRGDTSCLKEARTK